MPCSDADFEYLQKLVQAHSANMLDKTYRTLLDTRLQPLMRLAGVANLEQLCTKLRSQSLGSMHRSVAELMTINETTFFRDARCFEVLRDEIFPQLIEQRKHLRALRIWSAASASGQEAYSVAMLLQDSFPSIANEWSITILGTDYSGAMVKCAQRGRYRRMEMNRGLPARMLVKYFARQGDEWEVCRNVKAMCEFRQLNLSVPLPPLPEFDLILLRNVMIYFPPLVRDALMNSVRRVLAPHGALLLGSSEQAGDAADYFNTVFSGNMFYYRVGMAT